MASWVHFHTDLHWIILSKYSPFKKGGVYSATACKPISYKDSIFQIIDVPCIIFFFLHNMQMVLIWLMKLLNEPLAFPLLLTKLLFFKDNLLLLIKFSIIILHKLQAL